jgi:hypothetical protein
MINFLKPDSRGFSEMSYLPPFDLLKQKVRVISSNGSNGKGRIDMKYEDFMALIRLMLRAVKVDEKWYRAKYPDVAEAIKAGTYKSAKHHFVEEGYFEDRLPYEFTVDDEWYTANYPDIAVGIRSGALGSPKEHFESHGYKEGRLPSEY